jgi:hypothetical protein
MTPVRPTKRSGDGGKPASFSSSVPYDRGPVRSGAFSVSPAAHPPKSAGAASGSAGSA